MSPASAASDIFQLVVTVIAVAYQIACVSFLASVSFLGQRKEPLSRRLYNSRNPSPLPQQSFYLTTVSSAEQVKAPAERIQGQLSLHDGGKAVDSFPHVRISGDKIHVTTTSKITKYFATP